MAKPQSVALTHWARIIQRWPVDKVRPENVSFQKIMQQRMDKLTSKPSPSTAATSVKANEALVTATPPPVWDESQELRQSNVLDSLLENRYSNQYPMPELLRNPASQPTYYDDLVREMQEAPNRSWFAGLVMRIKGSLRLS